jgi:TRAP-type C4-dicarboxylate transport system substrate-binding protein
MDRRQFAFLISTLALAPHAKAAPSVCRLATGYRAESFHGRNLATFGDDVAAATGGAVRIELHPNNSLVKLGEIFGAVEAGRIEAGEAIMSGLVKSVPIAGADAVPFIVSSYDDAQRMWRCQRPLVERHFGARGLTLLYAVPWPPQGLFSTRPITGAPDFKGTRMRTYNATTVRIAQLLGAQPVDVPMVGVAQALAAGKIDNMITSGVTGVENQVWSHVSHFYEINAWFPKNIVFMKTGFLQSLAPAHRAALLDASRAAELRGWQASRTAAVESVEELKRRGMKVERIPRELDREVKRMGERFSLEWIREVGAEANRIFVPYYTQT